MDDRKPDPNLNPEDELVSLAQREDTFVAEVKQKLPEFVERCESVATDIIMHQDAFAADYSDEEFRLLGMAIKFAGLSGKTVLVIGTSRETV